MTAQCRKLPRESKDCKVPQSALGIAKEELENHEL